MRLTVNMTEHLYNNIIDLDSVNIGRCNYKGIIMGAINSIKDGTEQPESCGRLIDADAVYPWYVETFSAKSVGEVREIKPEDIRFSMNDIRENLDNIPTIDAAPIVHAKWKKINETHQECSECGMATPNIYAFLFHYCPYCGAKIDKRKLGTK